MKKLRLSIILIFTVIVLVPLDCLMLYYNLDHHVDTYYRNVLPVAKDKTYHGYQYDSFGIASWYDYDYPKGSGNWVTKNKFVVASRDYPRGTELRVCNKGVLDTNSFPTDCVDVVVTDYGPEEWTGRIIDMGSLAFSKICALSYGTCKVLIKEIK